MKKFDSATLTPILGNDKLDVCEIRDKGGNLIGHTTIYKNLPKMEVRGTIDMSFEYVKGPVKWRSPWDAN